MADREDRALLQFFGRAIHDLRERAGLSQEQLGCACGLHRTYIGGVERGERNLTLLSAERVASALGFELVDLLPRLKAPARRGAFKKHG